MSGWDWAQWVVILGIGGVVGWMAALGLWSVARLTEAIAQVAASVVSGTHQRYEVQPSDAQVDQPRETPDTGWRYVLLNADGSVGSIRRATNGSAPIRIGRGHGNSPHAWYRLTRIDGTALIYTLEPNP